MKDQRKFIKDRDFVDDVERASFSKETYQADAIRRGRFFQFTNRWTGVSGGDSVSVYVKNTSDSAPITLIAPVFQSTGKANVDVIRNPSNYGTTNSSEATLYNLNSSSSETSKTNQRYGSNVSISGGETIEQSIISGSGKGANKIGGTSRAGIVLYANSGDEVVITSKNTSGKNSDFSAVVGFVQEKEGIPPQQNR